MFKVIVQECKMSTESEKERASDVANGCKLIAVMWILIPINQGQCGLLCHLCTAGKKKAAEERGGGGTACKYTCIFAAELYTWIHKQLFKSPVCEDLVAFDGKEANC